MTKVDKTFRDLGQLYDFYREIRKARLKENSVPPRDRTPDQKETQNRSEAARGCCAG